jgi:hypothetical protein
VLPRQARAEHNNVAGVLHGEQPSGGELELEGLVSGIGSGDDAVDQVRDAEPYGRIGLPKDLDLRLDRGHAVDCRDGVGVGESHR